MEEEKKAIEVLKVKYLSEYLNDEEVKFLFKHIEKQDKMIDYMAEKLAKKYLSHPRRCTLKEKENIKCDKFENCTQCIKEYFRKRVEEDAKN